MRGAAELSWINLRSADCRRGAARLRDTLSGATSRSPELASESQIGATTSTGFQRSNSRGDHMTAELSIEQVELYGRDGFLSPIRIAKSDQAAAWRRELEDNERDHGRLHYVAKAHLVLDFAHRLASHPSVLDAVSSIIGPDILLWDSTFIIKEPGDGKKVSWHQDLTYWGLDPDDIVSVWLALSAATIESGCMLMIPGSHTGPIAAHYDTRQATISFPAGRLLPSRSTKARLGRGSCAWRDVAPPRPCLAQLQPQSIEDRRIGFQCTVSRTLGQTDGGRLGLRSSCSWPGSIRPF